MTDVPVTVDIVDVVPKARKIPARELKVGDALFDVYGGQHPIVSVQIRKNVSTKRDDGWRDLFDPDDMVTVVIGEDR